MLNLSDLLLVISKKPNRDQEAVRSAWSEAGGRFCRVDRFWDPPLLDSAFSKIYGNPTFCRVIAEALGLDLVSPPDDLLLQIDHSLAKRQISLACVGELHHLRLPVFIKPVRQKLFPARVYTSREELDMECEFLPDHTLVLVSEVVDFEAEARAFVLDGAIQDCAVYRGNGNLPGVSKFLQRLVEKNNLPRSCVLDAGYIRGRGWALVEANATWGASPLGCRVERILPCIAAATELRRL